MYRGGLTRSRIAALTRAPAATVGYHLSVALAADPELQAAHEKAAAGTKTQVSAQGLARMRELVAMVQETGRYPSRTAGDVAERALASWLERRRRDAAAGTLAPAFRDGLAVLPDWQRPPRAVADEARWQDRLAALARYRAAGHDWPRHKAAVAGEEHDLGVWLHSQRKSTAAANSNRPRPGRWMRCCRAGAPGGGGAANPGRRAAGDVKAGRPAPCGAGLPCFPSAKGNFVGQRRRCRC
jgi:hypothetical protein